MTGSSSKSMAHSWTKIHGLESGAGRWPNIAAAGRDGGNRAWAQPGIAFIPEALTFSEFCLGFACLSDFGMVSSFRRCALWLDVVKIPGDRHVRCLPFGDIWDRAGSITGYDLNNLAADGFLTASIVAGA